jgi:hypothetical protein
MAPSNSCTAHRIAGVMALAMLAAAATALSATGITTVFRCSAHGRVVYTDSPCPDGARLELDPGRAAPDARERLQRDQRLLDEAAAQRRTSQEREDARRPEQDERATVAAQSPTAGYAGTSAAYPAYVPYGAFAPDRRLHSRRQHRGTLPPATQRVVPVPPPVPDSLRRR